MIRLTKRGGRLKVSIAINIKQSVYILLLSTHWYEAFNSFYRKHSYSVHESINSRYSQSILIFGTIIY